MATLGSETAQQRWLHVGDTVLLFLRARRGYVYSELSGSQHNHVTVFPEQQLDTEVLERKESLMAAQGEDADPFFPNTTYACFKVMLPNKCKAQQRYCQLKIISESGGAVTESEMVTAQRAAELEEKQNIRDQDKNSHRAVLYGDRIQLMHMGSKRYITVSSEHTSRTENNSLLVQLTKQNSNLCVFNVLPRYKIRSLGDKVCYWDQIKFESTNTQGHFLHCSNRPLKSVGVTLHSDHFELNLSATESAMTVVPHFSPSSLYHPTAIRGGTCIRIFHREDECYLVAEGSFADHSPVVENVHCRQRRTDLKSHSKPSTSANTYWQIEKETDARSGEILFWKECCRIKHLPTRLYLTLEMNDDDEWNVVLKEKELDDPDPETLFLFTPLIEEGDEIIAGSYSGVQHLVSGRYLHVLDEKPYKSAQYCDKMMPDIQSTPLFTLTATRDKGDCDAFILQPVEDQCLDNFNYVAGIVPILKAHIDSINQGVRLMEKEATQVSFTLSELCTWLCEPDSPKETKNRQKLLRNLRVLEQLMEILRSTDKRSLLSSSLHVTICKECYNVIQQYLKGDSRKNENYVAQFIEFFQSQVGKGLNAENVLVEIVQDNFGIISMMASTQLDSTMGQLYETKNPTFLHFLSSLCICSGRPIRATQEQVLSRLFQSQVGDLLLRTEAREDAGCVRVYCSRSDVGAIDVAELHPGQYMFKLLEAQILLFARLCEGNNEKAINQLMFVPATSHSPAKGFVSLKEALTCGSGRYLHPLLRSRYVLLILNMFVKVGKNWTFLDHLCYSFVYDDLVKNPYQFSAGEQTTALTGETNVNFPVLQEWILAALQDNKVMHSDKEHIIHNEVLAQILDVLCHLVNYGYYDSAADVEAILAPLTAMLAGQEDLKEFRETGTLQDTRENRALFDVTEKALLVVHKLLIFNLYVTLQRFLHDFKQMEEDKATDPSISFLNQLRYMTESSQLQDDDDDEMTRLELTTAMRNRLQVISSDFYFPRNQMKAILINVSRYKSDHLACLALSILTQMHCFESALFSQAAEVQLLISRESLVEYRTISSLLPTLRHLLSIDCSIQGQWKILEILEKLTKMCCMPDEEEPHQQNQHLLCNFGVVSDILNYVLAKGSQYQTAMQKRKVSTHDSVPSSEHEQVLRRSLHLLQALACRNEPVQKRLFSRLHELLNVDLPILPLADLLTEVFTGCPELSLNVKEEDVEQIFQLVVECTDMFAQSQLMETLDAMAKIEDVDLSVKRNQALIVKSYCQYSDTFHTELFGEEKEKQERRWTLLTQSSQSDPELQLLLSFTDLMATCAEGESSLIDSVCQNLFTVEELIRILSEEGLSVTRKKPFVRFLLWVYMHTDAGNTSRNTLAHGETMWAYLKSVGNLLTNINTMLQSSPHQQTLSPFGTTTLRASKRRRKLSATTKPPVSNPILKQFKFPKIQGEDGKLLVAVLEYLTSGIVPLLNAFYKYYFDSVWCSVETREKELQISASIATALFDLGGQMLKYSNSKMQLQRFHEAMNTVYAIGDIRSMMDVNPEFVIKFMRQAQVQRGHVNQSLRHYKQLFSRQASLNTKLHVFVKMCEKSYMGPNTAEHQIKSPVPELYYSDEGEELPLGPNFQDLVHYFMLPTDEVGIYVSADCNSCCVRCREEHCHDGWIAKPEAELLLKQLEISVASEDYLSEADQQRQDLLDIRCLQVLRALIHNQIKMIDPELKDRDPVVYRRLCEKYVHPVQISVQQFGNAVEKVAPIISHPNEEVAREVLSFLKALLFSGNRTVQKGFELFSESREDKMIITFKARLEAAINRYEESCSLKDELKARREYRKMHVRSPSILRTSQTLTPTMPRKSVKLKTSSLPRNLPSPGAVSYQETSLHVAVTLDDSTSIAEDKVSIQSATLPRISVMKKNLLKHLGQEESDDETEDDEVNQIVQPDTSFTLVLEVMGLMCDGQFKSMQDYLRDQPGSYKSTDMVATVADLLQTYASGECSDNYEIVHKILQTLIEMCVGNPTNQLVILDHQIIESINHLLHIRSHPPDCNHLLSVLQCSVCGACKKFTEILTVKGSAVEMLECMLEYTSHQTSVVIDGVLGSLDRSGLLKTMVYFHEMQSHPLVKTVQMDDDAERGMFRAYHTHVILEDNCDEEESRELAITPAQNSLMKFCKTKTRSVEITYGEEEPLVTKVYFPHTKDLRREVTEKVKWSISRESIEDKQRALLDLFEPLKRDIKHQILLRKNIISTAIISFSQFRHRLLNLLTFFLCILMISILAEPMGVPANPKGEPYYEIMYRIFGALHLLLALWMVVEYFLTNLPHFRLHLYIYLIIQAVLKYGHLLGQYLHKVLRRGASPRTKIVQIPTYSLLDISLPCLTAVWVLVFLVCSVLGIIYHGYFYSICALHVVFNNDILQRVLRAVTKNGISLLWVALLGIVILFIYSIVSFIFYHEYFYTGDTQLFCKNLGECFVSVLRYGLLDGIGLNIPLITRNQFNMSSVPDFEVAGARLLLDVSFFIIVTTIGLNIVFGIIVDTFSELREERSNIEEDQKSKCFICDIQAQEFDRHAQGFLHHVRYDHNLWDYAYYSLYVDSIDVSNHNAIQKYVHDMIKDTKIDFFPHETALCFEPEEDGTQMKLGLITRRLETIEQIFKTKEENRHIKAKRTERQKREEKVRRFLQRRGGAGRGDGGGLVFDPQSLSSLLPGLH